MDTHKDPRRLNGEIVLDIGALHCHTEDGKLSSQVQHIEDKNSRGERKPRHFLGRELIR